MELSPIDRIRLDKAAIDEGFGLRRPDDGGWMAYDSLGAPASIRLTSTGVNYLVAVSVDGADRAARVGVNPGNPSGFDEMIGQALIDGRHCR